MSSMREAVATKLDEITRYHDHMKQKQLGQSLRELAQQQKTDLYSLHEPRKVGSNDKHGC